MKLRITQAITTALLSASLVSPTAMATTEYIYGTVTQVLVDAELYGGCMAKLSESPKQYLPGCGADWVTFSCTGEYADQVIAIRMLDQAQLAMATNKYVYVAFDDNRIHDGYCFASSIYVTP